MTTLSLSTPLDPLVGLSYLSCEDCSRLPHTSGAPKPVFYSHRFLGVFDLDRMVPDIQGRSCGGLNIYGDSNTAFLVASPMFHLSGLASSLAPLWAGSTMILPPADIPPSASIVLDMMRDVDVHTVGLPPSIWEDLVSECAEDFLKVSKHLKYVIYGGGRYPAILTSHATSSAPLPLTLLTTDPCSRSIGERYWQLVVRKIFCDEWHWIERNRSPTFVGTREGRLGILRVAPYPHWIQNGPHWR